VKKVQVIIIAQYCLGNFSASKIQRKQETQPHFGRCSVNNFIDFCLVVALIMF